MESKVRNQKPGSQNKKSGDSGKDGRNERQTYRQTESARVQEPGTLTPGWAWPGQ